ncbi:hypothetical protein [uncultured Tenacibaculum sp.]|uniref:hypothetical protein n=1 Tax=uncultured Tenacibaculum sp. TaxID=174713 RepID=UPI00260927B4|nr:hypothetical protein [uncultured Tenacibaculum sp.]
MKTNFLFLIMIITSYIGYSQIFYDDVSGETMGDFPSKWDVITGMETVEAIDGFNTISLLHGSIIKPVVNNQTNNYINGDFTIEFDAFFGKTSSIYGQRIIVRLWNGKYSHKQGNIRYNPFIIKRNGISTSWLQSESGKAENFFKDLHTLEPIWRHVKIACKNSNLKIFLDNKLVLNLPRFKMQPTMVSVGGAINDSKYDAKVGIANFRITSIKNNSSNLSGSKIILIVDNKTNKIQNIELFETMQNPEIVKKKYPNSSFYKGMLYGNYSLVPTNNTVSAFDIKNSYISGDQFIPGDTFILLKNIKTKIKENKNGIVVLKTIKT